MNNTQYQSSLPRSKSSKKKTVAFFVVAAVFVACGTAIWVLNIVGVMPGPWANVFSAVFTGIGILVALLSCLLSLISMQEAQGE